MKDKLMGSSTKQRNSGFAGSFLHAVGVSAGALLLSANVAFAQDQQVAPARSFSFDPQILCGDAKGLHAVQSACYSTLATEMQAYADNAATKYLEVAAIDDAVLLLNAQNPAPAIEIDREKQVIFARWLNEKGDLHREGAPAYIKIDFTKNEYTEMRFEDGVFASNGSMPSYVKYAPDSRIKLQWDKGDEGQHNLSGPAIIEYDLTGRKMNLKWSVDSHSANAVDPTRGPTYAEVNLSSNVAYFQEFSSGDGRMHNRRHRNDCVHILRSNPETGAPTEIAYMYHDQDFMTDDEYHVTVHFSDEADVPPMIMWSKGGSPIPPPAGFSLPEDSYCTVPGLAHPAAKYEMR